MDEEIRSAGRRAFIKRAATLTATAPAAALLLSASGRTAAAGRPTVPPDAYGVCPPGTIPQDGICVPVDE